MTAVVIALGAVIWLILLLVCVALSRAAALGDLLATESGAGEPCPKARPHELVVGAVVADDCRDGVRLTRPDKQHEAAVHERVTW